MKHFKLFLLPLLAITLVFSSCEQQDLSLTYIEPIQDWGKSPQDILEKMTKSKSGATLEYSESDDGYYYMEFKSYGISQYLAYAFIDNKLIGCSTSQSSITYKQTIKNHIDKKHTLIQVDTNEYYEEYLYCNKEKTSSILFSIDNVYGEMEQYYIPYIEGDIEDFWNALE